VLFTPAGPPGQPFPRHHLEVVPLEVTLIPAVAATVNPDGSINMLSAFLRHLPPQPVSYVVVAAIEVPWAEVGAQHSAKLALFNTSGHEAIGNNNETVVFTATFTTQRNPSVLLGEAAMVYIPFGVAPIPLQPGRYRWQFWLDDATNLDWERIITVAAAPPLPMAS
jgi:hypothetical protein